MEQYKDLRFILRLLLAIFLFAPLVACNNNSGSYYAAALGLNKARLLVAVQNTNSNQVVSYDLNGKLLGVVADYSAIGGVPRGISVIDGLRFLVPLNGLDRIDMIQLDGTTSIWTTNVQYTGTLYHSVRDSSGNIYSIETNTLEKFDSSGSRIPTTGATPYVNTTLGACTLAVPRSVVINSNGQLVVVSNTSGAIAVYTVTGATTAVCVSSTVLGAGIGATAMIFHSDGSLYIAGGTNSNIYKASATGTGGASIFNNTAIISAPSSMVELPDGTILVSSTTTASIERINTVGTRIGTTSFIKDGFTANVSAMAIIQGQ